MAITLEQKNLATYLSEFQERMRRRTNINLFDRDSKTQALIDVFSDQLLADRRDFSAAIDNLQKSKAKGTHLEALGANDGVKPFSERFASVSKSELCLAFLVDSGVFGDLNGGASFTIPKGTKVWSDAKQNDLGVSIYYSLTEDVLCTNTGTIAYASARADASGAEFNVGSATLKNHNYSKAVRVINFYSILNGRNRETEDQFRFRLAQFYTTVATTNETKAQLLALSVPGVLDTRIVRGHFGIGTTAVVVLGAEYQSNDALVNSVQLVLNNLNLPGVSVRAIPAVNALVDIEATLYSSKVLSTADQARVTATLKRVTVNYLRSKGLGGNFSILELAKIWSKYTGGLVQFKSSSVEIFDRVFIRRGYVSSVVSERETLRANTYILQADEFADLGTLTLSFA